ncbi:hypothetical protein [Isoptericola variabilis]|uniref:Uncharacterized protein n=1 Tax=Isoptericola variabilis (strain 225) TaxID=743718 RepID=F6FUG8_ISOV2|nr:hypothetical protein [Isoptericola variabilis]AEG45395.1 hypothetical protein Isova_2693 [Isoptericola variabilis 225]TWH30261.1 hypothetical protein L600_003000000130 [Isoptericola variabilis J7]
MTLTSRAVTTAVLSAVVAVTAILGTLELAAASALLVLLLAVGWSPLLRLPSKGGPALVLALTGLGAVGVAWATEGEPVLRHLPLVVAMGLVLAFVAEMLRGGGRLRLVESVSGTVTGVVAAVACAGWVAAGRSEAGEALVVTSAVGLALASGVSALRFAGGWLGSLAGVGLAGAAGAGAGAVVPEIDPLTGLLAGLVSGLVVAALRLLFERQPALARRRAGLSAAALPVAVGGVLIFAVGRVVVG